MTSVKQLTVAEFPTYEEYKDSGVEWLGEVPKEWECLRLGSFFNERRTKASDKDFAALSVTRNGIMPQLENAAKTKDGDNRKLVLSGDFVINSRSDRKGSSGVSNLEGTVSLINIVLEPKEVEPAFIHHLLKSYAFIEEYYRVGRGIVADLWTTRYDEMRTIILAMPSKKEQTLIAQFLDQKTALIDQAIAIKEQQIKLLNERKQIIIQQAVTQGLNPNAPMKDSDVEWIGQIPEHWEVKRIKYCLSLNKSRVESSKTELQYFGMESIQSEQGVLSGVVSEADGLASRFQKGDILFGKLRPYLAKVWLADCEGVCSTEFLVFSAGGELDSQYAALFFLSKNFINIVDGSTYGSKMPRASTDYILNLFHTIPPKAEQIDIVAYIKQQSSYIDKYVLNVSSQISALKEYKTTLINSAVTGKIKINEAMLADTQEVSYVVL